MVFAGAAAAGYGAPASAGATADDAPAAAHDSASASQGPSLLSLPPMLVTAAADRTLRLWTLETMRRLRVVYNRPAETSALAVSRWAGCLLWDAGPAVHGCSHVLLLVGRCLHINAMCAASSRIATLPAACDVLPAARAAMAPLH